MIQLLLLLAVKICQYIQKKEKIVRKKAEEYDESELTSISIRIYLEERKVSVNPFISDNKIA